MQKKAEHIRLGEEQVHLLGGPLGGGQVLEEHDHRVELHCLQLRGPREQQRHAHIYVQRAEALSCRGLRMLVNQTYAFVEKGTEGGGGETERSVGASEQQQRIRQA
jgi:hypothetical protein